MQMEEESRARNAAAEREASVSLVSNLRSCSKEQSLADLPQTLSYVIMLSNKVIPPLLTVYLLHAVSCEDSKTELRKIRIIVSPGIFV